MSIWNLVNIFLGSRSYNTIVQPSVTVINLSVNVGDSRDMNVTKNILDNYNNRTLAPFIF